MSETDFVSDLREMADDPHGHWPTSARTSDAAVAEGMRLLGLDKPLPPIVDVALTNLVRDRGEARAALDRVRAVLAADDAPSDLWRAVDEAICDHEGMSASGVDQTPLDNPAKVWACDNCGRIIDRPESPRAD